jgi:Tol biopolymer transport system component
MDEEKNLDTPLDEPIASSSMKKIQINDSTDSDSVASVEDYVEVEISEDPETVDNDEPIADDTHEEPKIDEPQDFPDFDKTVGNAIDASKSESDVFEADPEIDAAVDDIVRSESDAVIAETDAKLSALEEKNEKHGLVQRVKSGLRAGWENRPVRYGVMAGLSLLFISVALLPTARYAVLNFFGVRVSSSMLVVDSQTRLPLKNITVQLQDQSAITNDDGEVSFTELKLGGSQLVISKRGYAENQSEIVLGWGSNPIGEQSLVATGERFTFVLSDWKSGAPITEAEATSGENSAVTDDTGKIVITIGEENIADVEIIISAKGYRTEKYSSELLANDETKVEMVPGKKHAFVSNRNGDYDLYTIDVDGKNEKLLLEATGKEREVPTVIPHATKDTIAFVSSRGGEENKGGFILDGLYIVDGITGENERIARSEQLQVIGWSGDRIIFLQVVEGTSQGNSERSKLVSYDYVTKERKDLATSNYFNDVELVGDKLYYAVSSYAVPESQAKLYSINVDGQNKQKIVDVQVWNIFRTAYDKLLLSAVDQKWLELVGDGPAEPVPQQASPTAKNFVNSPDGKRAVWVEVRDGKGVLLKSPTTELKEEQVINMPGLSDVLYWANNSSVVFRVINNQETADYILNLDGGEVQKITDVTATRNSYF